MQSIVTVKEYTHIQRENAINRICEEYRFLKRFNIGKSCLGKNITALKLGVSDSYCLITAGIHGSERITSLVSLMFLEDLCRAYKTNGSLAEVNIRKGLQGRGVIIVPCVNPDGCDISLLGEKACLDKSLYIRNICKNNFKNWNANFRGVDLNHNFDADWRNLHNKEKAMGIIGPSKSRFGGYKPHSEPETVALVELCRKVNIRHTLSMHSQGEVIYWTFGDKVIPKAKRMAEILATTSGYALDVPINIATGGGFKDWFIKEFSRPGFTVEIGKGENPLPIDDAKNIYQKIKEMLVLYCIM